MATKTDTNESPQKDETTAKTGDTQATEAKADKTAAAPKIDPMEELVEIMIPRSEKNPGPVPIGVNGKIVLVKRGELVKVKRKYAEVLKLSYAMENEAADKRDALQREFVEARL